MVQGIKSMVIKNNVLYFFSMIILIYEILILCYIKNQQNRRCYVRVENWQRANEEKMEESLDEKRFIYCN